MKEKMTMKKVRTSRESRKACRAWTGSLEGGWRTWGMVLNHDKEQTLSRGMEGRSAKRKRGENVRDVGVGHRPMNQRKQTQSTRLGQMSRVYKKR